MRVILLILGTSVREAVRRKLVALGLAVSAAFLALYGLGWHLATSGTPVNAIAAQQASSFFLLLGLYAADLLVAVITILVASDALSGDIASGAMQTLASKPLPRWQLLLGKWLGLMVLFTALQAVLFGGVLALGYGFGHVAVAHAAHGLLLLWWEMVLLLTLTLLWGTRLPTLANGVLSLGLFGIAFLGGWIEQWGSVTQHSHAVLVGIVASLLMPSEALWHRAAFEMQSPLASALSASVGSPFAGFSVPSHLMIVYAVAYATVALVLALRSFAWRDL